jgi:hypothetical protein
MKYRLALLIGAMLLPGAAWAQRLQNVDIYMLGVAAFTDSYSIPGSNVTVQKARGFSTTTGYGYQIARTSAGSIWIDLSPAFVLSGRSGSSIGGRADNGFSAFTLGLRFMLPIHSRVALLGTAAGGGGAFHYPVITGGERPRVTSNSTWHGVAQLGGGLDFRLTRLLSIRGEVRNYSTGKGLSGATGRHHVVPMIGVAFHF